MDALSKLIDALRCLPGVGPKSAQRMTYHLLQHQRNRGINLAICLKNAMEIIGQCQQCNTYTEHPICAICQDKRRETGLLCIVENPTDVLAIEQSHTYHGQYFVLMGKISPLDGLGPDEIGLPKLYQRVLADNISEIILALSPSVEGQTTVHFIYELFAKHAISITQLAQGIPSGGELEYLDANTISSALKNRAKVL